MWDYGRRKSDGRRVEDRARAEAVKKLKEIEEQMDSFFKLYAGVNCDSINMPTPKCSECGCILSKEEIAERVVKELEK